MASKQEDPMEAGKGVTELFKYSSQRVVNFLKEKPKVGGNWERSFLIALRMNGHYCWQCQTGQFLITGFKI
jgi:hypothetical protein